MISSSTKTALLFCIPALLIAILYSPTLSFSLVWDDFEWVRRVMARQEDFYHWFIYAFSSETLGIYYRPLALLTFYYPFAGQAPVSFWHFLNYSLYITDIFLLGMIFFGLYKSSATNYSAMPPAIVQKSRLIFGLGLLLFVALHPTQIETVSWISCRFDLMSNTFLLIILVLEVFGSGRLYQYLLQSLLFLLALLSKESAMVFLGIYPILLYCMRMEQTPDFFVSLRKNYRPLLFLAASAIVYCLVWLNIANFSGFADRVQLTPIYNDHASHLYAVLATTGYFVRLLVYPFIELSPYYYHEGNVQLLNPHVWLGVITVAAFLYALIKQWRFLPVMAVFFMAAFPFLNWSQISSTGDIIQNRYLSLPLLLGSCALYLFFLRHNLPVYLSRYRIVALPYIFFTGFTAVSILPLWTNNLSLWNWVVTENPRSPHARSHLASELKNFKEYDAALKHLEISLQLMENFWSYSSIAQILWLKGDYENSNLYLLKSLEYPAILEDKVTFMLDMANKNLQSKNTEIASYLLQSMPAEYYTDEPFKHQHAELMQKLKNTAAPEK